MTDYYVRRGARIVGPIPQEKLAEIVASGKVLGTDEIAQHADGPWLGFTRVKRLLVPQEFPPRNVEQPLEAPLERPIVHKPPRVAVHKMSQARLAIQEREQRRKERQVETLRVRASQQQTLELNAPADPASALVSANARPTVQDISVAAARGSSSRSQFLAILLAALQGGFATHKIYLGEPWTQRLLLACTGIGLPYTILLALRDSIALLRMSRTTFDQRYGV